MDTRQFYPKNPTVLLISNNQLENIMETDPTHSSNFCFEEEIFKLRPKGRGGVSHVRGY